MSGTKDGSGEEIETLLSIEKTNELTAAGFSKVVIEKIEELGINVGNIIRQCYDGAFVMSGVHGGVQKLIEVH